MQGSSLGAAPARVEPRYTKHLRDLSLEELFALGEAVEQLVAQPGWDLLTSVVQAEVAEIDRRLDGRDEPLSRAGYAMAHGRRSGLRAAIDAAEAILHRYRTELEGQRDRHERGAEAPLGV